MGMRPNKTWGGCPARELGRCAKEKHKTETKKMIMKLNCIGKQFCMKGISCLLLVGATGTIAPTVQGVEMSPSETEALFPSGKLAVGANYWASHAATQMWTKWDAAEVEKDLIALKDAGMTVLRVFPNWADFQPIVAVPLAADKWNVIRETRMFLSEDPLPDTPCGRAGVDERMVVRFEQFCDLAEKYGFRLIVPLLTGQMTFRNYIPPALVHLDPYADPYALKWEARYLECLVTRLKGKKAIVAWESGNEARILGNVACKERAEFWQRYVHDVIRRADPSRPVVGVDGLNLTSDSPWPTEVNALLSDWVTMHPYHFWGAQYRDDFRSVRSTTYASAVTHILADVSGRPAFIEEHGSRRQEQASQSHVADYLRAMLWNAWDSDCRAMLWWCAFDQTGMEIAPYDWKEPCVELGAFRRDRTPYPGVETIRKFVAFQQSLPFASLPKAKPNAHFIVSDPDVAHASFILAKQAGLRPSFQSSEQPIRDAKVYFLPVATGRACLTLRNWRALKEKVHAGATLYLSLRDTFLDSLEDVAGIEVNYRDGQGETLACTFHGFSLSLASDATRRYRALSAETLAHDAQGNGVFFVNRYGKGKVYTLTMPMESDLYKSARKFASDAHRIYGIVAPTHQLLKTGSRDVIATEHCFGGGRCGVVIVNNSPKSYEAKPTLADGWEVESALTDDPSAAAWTDGTLRLDGNAGILLHLSKVMRKD